MQSPNERNGAEEEFLRWTNFISWLMVVGDNFEPTTLQLPNDLVLRLCYLVSDTVSLTNY